MQQILDDIVIADFTQLMQGGWAAQKLGDMGADVIKIEPPHGEPERQVAFAGEFFDGVAPGFLAKDRNKRSVALDLKSDEGRQAALDIIAEADVLMENFRPDVMERLELSYEDVREVNEDIIYVSASAYGSSGPYVERPGQDLLYQAMTGLTALTGRADDPPTPGGTVFVDEHSATLIAYYTVSALFHRERTGEGQKLEASLLDSAVDFMCQEITFALNSENEPKRGEKMHGHHMLNPPYGIYETADSYLALGYSPLPLVAETLDLEDELDTYESQAELYEYRDQIHDVIEAETRQWQIDELVDHLSAADIQAVEVAKPGEVADDPQIQHNEMIIEVEHPNGGTFQTTGFPVDMSETEEAVTQRPPELGEHTAEVLAELGYDDDKIAAITGVNDT
ncbi:CaiB/BaiF CoA transferase family protein [Halobellus limi]|nr:CoA transferase [Halobellus limi]SEG63009.1 Crotonobetainyl-CoA:carnitine CoA-transferase CaiB [Halobellus limi]